MLVLALDTATDAVVAGVVSAADVAAPGPLDALVGAAQHVGAHAQGEQLAVVVEAALAAAGVSIDRIDVVAVGRGPGPFTGLRVGLAFAESLGWARGVPVHGVCTLDVLAADAQARRPGELLVATDARRREVYWAQYGADGTRRHGPAVDRPLDVPGRTTLPVVGAGAELYPDAFPNAVGDPVHPDPGALGRLVAEQVRAGAAPDVTPLYLRRPDAVAAAGRKPVTPR